MGKLTSAIAGVFKTIVTKALGPAPEPQKVVRPRDQKTILTKALNRYINKKLMPVKISGRVTPAGLGRNYVFDVIITPGSDMAVIRLFEGQEQVTMERLTFPRLSDYFVVNGAFNELYDELKKALEQLE